MVVYETRYCPKEKEKILLMRVEWQETLKENIKMVKKKILEN